AVHRIGQALRADPAGGIARHLDRGNAVIEVIVPTVRLQRPDARSQPRRLALARGRGRLVDTSVDQRGQTPPRRRGAAQVAVLEPIAGAINTWALAVPDAEHAIVVGSPAETDLLAAPHRSRRQVFIQSRLKMNVGLFQVFLGLPQRQVIATQRRPPITGYEA